MPNPFPADEPAPTTDNPPQNNDRSKEPKSPTQLVRWMLKTAIEAKIGLAVLKEYANYFKLMEGWKQIILYPLTIVAYTIDMILVLLMLVSITAIILGIVIALLRAINVTHEILTIFNIIANHFHS